MNGQEDYSVNGALTYYDYLLAVTCQHSDVRRTTLEERCASFMTNIIKPGRGPE